MERCPKCGAPVNREDGPYCGNCGCEWAYEKKIREDETPEEEIIWEVDDDADAVSTDSDNSEETSEIDSDDGKGTIKTNDPDRRSGRRGTGKNSAKSKDGNPLKSRRHKIAKRAAKIALILLLLGVSAAAAGVTWILTYKEPEASVWVCLSDIPREADTGSEYALFSFAGDSEGDWYYFCGNVTGQDNVVTFTVNGEYRLLSAVLIGEEGCGYDDAESAEFKVYADGKLLYKKRFDGEACKEPFCIEISNSEQIEVHLPGDAKIHLADAWLVRK